MEELIDMASKNDEKWLLNYDALKAYIEEHHHLPDKHKIENRGLLSKYQMKKKKAGTLTEAQERMLKRLADSRSTEHRGGRRKNLRLDSTNSPTKAQETDK